MSFLARNEYLLEEIDYYHGQISARLVGDQWSETYRRVWESVCLQLGWDDCIVVDGPGERMVRTLLRRTRYARRWVYESPVLKRELVLPRSTSVTCRTMFGFELVTNGQDAWEPLAHGLLEPGETLLISRLLPYVEYFVDVGAGSGYFSFLAAQQGVAVTAFEPSPPRHKQLRAGIAANRFANVAAPACSVGDTPQGGAFYLESGPQVKPLSMADYRATGSLARLAAGLEPKLLQGAADWLGAYDAPTVVVAGETGRPGLPRMAEELAKYDYRIFAVARQPVHGAPLLAPPGNAAGQPASYLALPPMTQDLAEPLGRPVDLRVFTPTEKLENLYCFMRNSFDEARM